MAAQRLSNDGTIDTRQMRNWAKLLRREAPKLNRQMIVKLRLAGGIVAEEAKAIVGPHSTSIPPTIKVRTRGATVAVRAGGAVGGRSAARELFDQGYGSRSSDAEAKRLLRGASESALAGLYELGNKGGSPGSFRHPVFGQMDQDWETQEGFPFLKPAADKKAPEVEAAVLQALDETMYHVAVDPI
jgi:hypothetical protein